MNMRLITILILMGFLFLNACKEDEPPISAIEFDADQHDGGELSLYESTGGVASFHPLLYDGATGTDYEIEIKLSRPVAETTIIRFSTSGSATRSSATSLGDFDIDAEGDLLVIDKGGSSVELTVTIFEDYEFEITSGTELYEMFTIELEEVVSGTGKLGENISFDVYILEDDPIILLNWDPQDDPGTDAGDVDMDLIVWMDGDQLTASAASGSEPEGISLPAGFPNAQYGFSYTYYSGSSNDLDFFVDIINLGGNLNGSPEDRSYTKTYTANNKNQYDVSGNAPFIAQTMNKSGLNYTNLTDITVNSSGSRTEAGEITIPRGQMGKYPLQRVSKATINEIKKATGF